MYVHLQLPYGNRGLHTLSEANDNQPRETCVPFKILLFEVI
jgi:hypothetical protein